MNTKANLEIDKNHLWHPYTSTISPLPVYAVKSCDGVYIELEDGRRLIDGMSSWWAAVHGYNHPRLNAAMHSQLQKMSHVMFGGLTHSPATELAKRLLTILPESINKIFYCDSGSVAVEVAMKMALQYQGSRGMTRKTEFITTRCGYHGDTWNAMSVCDPEGGMHSIFNGRLAAQHFLEEFPGGFDTPIDEQTVKNLERKIRENHDRLAAFIIEPVVQGAGGMRFYNPTYLRIVGDLCKKYEILLIFDEIATGFGRTGKWLAMQHTGVVPDIVCLGKAITGGYMSFAATATSEKVATVISKGEAGVFMHGPTFMGNPLACAVACESFDILKENGFGRIAEIETILCEELSAAKSMPNVKDVRCLGAIGVVEMKERVKMAELQAKFVERGVWVRPFGRLVYIMPPFVISDDELKTLCRALLDVISE